MRYRLTLTISEEELKERLNVSSLDLVSPTDLIGDIRDFGEVISLKKGGLEVVLPVPQA